MRVVLALSGGLDSSTLLGELVKGETFPNPLTSVYREKAEAIEAVAFSYGAKHNLAENMAARLVAEWYGVPFRTIDLSSFMGGLRSALTLNDISVPEGHYEAESMRQTVVPGRNTIMTSVLAALAESLSFSHVALGIHAGDHYIYPDCRPAWFYSMCRTVLHSSDDKVSLIAPYLDLSKVDIVRRGLAAKIPYHLTSTCYKGGAKACGVCGSCQERLEAFSVNDKEDPIPYLSRTLLPK